MKNYKHYLIQDNQQFQPSEFSSIDDEINQINELTVSISPLLKGEILVSFLKDHSISKDWIRKNPQLAEMVSSGSLFTGNIESLFDSARTNPSFITDLEHYLMERFTRIHETAALAN